MKANILAKFEYNGKTYVYYIFPDKPKNLLYGLIDNNVIKPVVDPIAFKIMETVSNEIFVSIVPKDHIRLTKIKLNNKLFQIMYDKKTKLKFFYEIKNNVFCLPSREDMENLSAIYNKQVLFNFSESNESKNKSTFYKTVTIAGIACIVVMGSLLIFNNFKKPNAPTDAVVSAEITSVVNEVDLVNESTPAPKIDFSLEKLTDALNQNPNLTDEEKAFIFEHFDILTENPDYVDMYLTMQKLSTLKIEYDSSSTVLGVGACYYPYENKIVIYRVNSFDQLGLSGKSTLSHEIFHMLSNAYNSFGTSIYEGLTETLVSEKDFAVPHAYYEQCSYVKLLAEIIGPEPIKAFYLSGNIDYIVKALTNIIPDENAAYYFLSSLDDALIYGIDYSYGWQNSDLDLTDLSKEELKEAMETTKSFIGYTLDKYFYAARGYHMEEDFIMKIYYNYFFSDDPANIYVIDGDGKEVLLEFPYIHITKGYFLNKYIEKYPSGEFSVGEYIGEGANREYISYLYIIDENNRRLIPSETHQGAYFFEGTNLSKEIQKVN